MLVGVRLCPALVERGGGLSEYVQFAGAMTVFVGVLIGSYCFVLTSPGARENELWSGWDRENG